MTSKNKKRKSPKRTKKPVSKSEIKALHFIEYDEPFDNAGNIRCGAQFLLPGKDVDEELKSLLEFGEIPNHPIAGRSDYYYCVGLMLDNNTIHSEHSFIKTPDGTITQVECPMCKEHGVEHLPN